MYVQTKCQCHFLRCLSRLQTNNEKRICSLVGNPSFDQIYTRVRVYVVASWLIDALCSMKSLHLKSNREPQPEMRAFFTSSFLCRTFCISKLDEIPHNVRTRGFLSSCRSVLKEWWSNLDKTLCNSVKQSSIFSASHTLSSSEV